MSPICSIHEALANGLLEGSACVFGVFDGLHRGHAHLIGKARALACEQGLPLVGLTFDIDPDELFASGTLRKLSSNEQRLRHLSESGLDAVCVLPFTRQLAGLSPHDFLEQVLAPGAPSHLFAGSDMRFGAKACGGIETMQQWAAGKGLGMQVHPVQLLEVDGAPVTSTRIRACLADGDIAQANGLLGHAYELEGTVVQGRHEGRSLGFPTANLHVEPALRVLRDGVYAAYAEVEGQVGNQAYRAAASVGESPVFAQQGAASCEVHLLDFDRDIYGKRLQVRFHRLLRPMIAFKSVDDLVSTVRDNIAWVRDNMPEQEGQACDVEGAVC